MTDLFPSEFLSLVITRAIIFAALVALTAYTLKVRI